MKTKVWAHRGASAYAPENTLEAFELAVSQGADGVDFQDIDGLGSRYDTAVAFAWFFYYKVAFFLFYFRIFL